MFPQAAVGPDDVPACIAAACRGKTDSAFKNKEPFYFSLNVQLNISFILNKQKYQKANNYFIKDPIDRSFMKT